ncbi:MAG: carboxypeptidase-like regulatory domain-containing protein [Vicinamibacterales bacterium]
MLTSVTVSGPSSIAPGESAHYIATAHYSRGSSEDVTAAAEWFPAAFGSSSIRFTAPGVALGVANGEILARAVYQGTIGSIQVIVVQPGTFKLSGVISESGGGALAGVMVEVISGTGEGQRATTDFRGTYNFYGVAQQILLRASAEGFTPQVHAVVIAGNSATDSFALTPVETPADVSGVWTMTVTAAPGCRAGLPSIAQGRSYQVQLIQQGTGLRVQISASTLQVANPQSFTGSVFGSRVRLVLPGDTSYGEWSTSNLYDQLSATEKLGFSGIVEGSVSSAEIRATMHGDLVYWNGATFDPAWYCRASDHAVTLRR